MAKIKVWLTTKFDCLIKSASLCQCDESQMILRANADKICLSMTENDCFFVYPIGAGISYAVFSRNGQIVEKPQIVIEKYFDDEFEVGLEPYLLSYPPVQCEVDDGTLKQFFAVGSPSVYSVQKGKRTYSCKIDQKFDEYKMFKFKNVPLLLLKGDEQTLIFCDNNFEFKKVSGTIEVLQDKIKVTAPLWDIAKRARQFCFVANGETLKKTDEQLIYLEGYPILPKHDGVLPLAFFQAIKAKDFDNARIFLSEDLQKTVCDDKILQSYFGEFDKIKPYNYSSMDGYFVALCTGFNNIVYRLRLKDAKITEIERLSKKNGVDTFD